MIKEVFVFDDLEQYSGNILEVIRIIEGIKKAKTNSNPKFILIYNDSNGDDINFSRIEEKLNAIIFLMDKSPLDFVLNEEIKIRKIVEENNFKNIRIIKKILNFYWNIAKDNWYFEKLDERHRDKLFVLLYYEMSPDIKIEKLKRISKVKIKEFIHLTELYNYQSSLDATKSIDDRIKLINENIYSLKNKKEILEILISNSINWKFKNIFKELVINENFHIIEDEIPNLKISIIMKDLQENPRTPYRSEDILKHELIETHFSRDSGQLITNISNNIFYYLQWSIMEEKETNKIQKEIIDFIFNLIPKEEDVNYDIHYKNRIYKSGSNWFKKNIINLPGKLYYSDVNTLDNKIQEVFTEKFNMEYKNKFGKIFFNPITLEYLKSIWKDTDKKTKILTYADMYLDEILTFIKSNDFEKFILDYKSYPDGWLFFNELHSNIGSDGENDFVKQKIAEIESEKYTKLMEMIEKGKITNSWIKEKIKIEASKLIENKD